MQSATPMLRTLALLFILPVVTSLPTVLSFPTVMWDGALLSATKATLSSSKSSPLQPALDYLQVVANHWVNESIHNKTFSVMTKPEAGPSGDKHDFYSLGTYWWPDPKTKTGLPYIDRDGLVNPETFDYDSVPLSQMIFAVSNLSLAFYFTSESRYCTAALHFMDTWFFDPATKMNPRSGLQYAQLIRGLDEGRGIGIIDAKDLAFIPDSALLLKEAGCVAFTAHKQAQLKEWLGDYVAWLSSSSHARDEFSQRNNHGTWFDIQALSLSLHVGNTSWARFLATDALRRIRVQVEPNGTLPMELCRTRSMHYTWWDLMAFFELAQAATHVGVDVFGYVGPQGRSLQTALDWVAPYVLQNSTAPWPYQEVSPFDHGKFFQILRVASLKFGPHTSARYEAMIPKLPGKVNYTTNTINLVWPRLH